MAKDIYQKPIDSSHNSNLDNNTPNVEQPSMGQAILELPGQYFNVLTRPSVKRFIEEKANAHWGIVWIQLISLAIIDAILQSVSLLISPNHVNSLTGIHSISPSMLLSITIITFVLLQLILTPVAFLAAGGILYLIARVLGGTGTFLEQIYATLLFGVPLVILSYLLLLIPATSSWLPYVPHLYSLVLFVVSLMAVHQLSRGKALSVVLIPIGVLLVLILVGTIILSVNIHH
jgi:hypothetical protein